MPQAGFAFPPEARSLESVPKTYSRPGCFAFPPDVDGGVKTGEKRRFESIVAIKNRHFQVAVGFWDFCPVSL
jgi:hypothetical protein